MEEITLAEAAEENTARLSPKMKNSASAPIWPMGFSMF
jgi:hypothetical protein